MSLIEFHHMDGRPVSIDQYSVILIEPHSSGDGTLMRVGPIERMHEMHIREEYEHVSAELKMSDFDRVVRAMEADKAAGTAIPFG